MQNAWDKLKKKWDEDPMQVLVVGALVATAAAKLLEASTARANSRSWNREVARRERMSYRK